MTQYTPMPQYDAAREPVAAVPQLRSPRRLANAVLVGLALVVALELASRVLSVASFDSVREAALDGRFDEYGAPDAPLAGLASGVGLLVAILPRLILGVVFVCWLHTVSSNLGSVGRRWGVGWTIGGWFTPVGAVFIPVSVVNEVDRLSDERAASLDGRPPARLRGWALTLWWVCFLLYQVAYPAVIPAAVVTDLGKSDLDPAVGLLVEIGVAAATFLVVAVAAGAAAVLVRRITANQERILAAYPAYVRR